MKITMSTTVVVVVVDYDDDDDDDGDDNDDDDIGNGQFHLLQSGPLLVIYDN